MNASRTDSTADGAASGAAEADEAAGTVTVAAAVLAGGRSSRMGSEKANLPLGETTLAGHVVDALRQAGLDPFIVSKPDRPVDLPGVQVVLEPAEPQHPLAGVAAAIRAAGERPVIVVACDLPLLPAEFLARLAALPGGTAVPAPDGEVQPLAARYSPGDLDLIESALVQGMAARTAVRRLDPVWLESDFLREFGDPARMFFNVNTPAGIRQAEALLGER